MKIYSATKFSIVIVPPKLSEKAKESKLLVRSFRHIYKVAGLGIATGLSGLFSLSMLQQDRQLPPYAAVDEAVRFEMEESAKEFERADSISGDESAGSITSSSLITAESQDITEYDLDVVNTANDVNVGALAGSDLFFPFIIITGILAGLTIYYLWKSLKKSGSK